MLTRTCYMNCIDIGHYSAIGGFQGKIYMVETFIIHPKCNSQGDLGLSN